MIEENRVLKAQLDLRFGMENIVGHDHRMLKIYDMIDSVADTRATVLITGESGTGKSMIARAIHRRSGRRDSAFVEVACGALPETLLESELFGHVAGAFTGAVGEKMGKFLQADGGTIFLDEIFTASPGMQVKLLRVLQDLEFEQVGGTKTFKIDTRVILATNEDLGKAVAEGRFRQDLFYRINVINIELPPLRERLSDIPLLAEHFLRRVCDDAGKNVRGFSDDAMAALQRYRWPGNVRELQNVIERRCCWARATWCAWRTCPIISSPPPRLHLEDVGNRSLKQAMESPERQIILEVLDFDAMESPCRGRTAGHQSHHALQEDEAAGAGRAARRRRGDRLKVCNTNRGAVRVLAFSAQAFTSRCRTHLFQVRLARMCHSALSVAQAFTPADWKTAMNVFFSLKSPSGDEEGLLSHKDLPTPLKGLRRKK